MLSALRRTLLVAALAISTFEVADGQTVCDQHFPFGVMAPEGGFVPGCGSQYVLRRTTGGGPASYISLDYPACASGPCAGMTLPLKYVCEATNGHSCCLSASQSIPLIAGNYVGPLRQGLDQRMANDTDTRLGICYSDYSGNGSRVGNVPLIRAPGLGASAAQVEGFLRMFLTGPAYSNSDIVVEFVAGPTPVQSASWGRTKILHR